jgi:hypothetical protein
MDNVIHLAGVTKRYPGDGKPTVDCEPNEAPAGPGGPAASPAAGIAASLGLW